MRQPLFTSMPTGVACDLGCATPIQGLTIGNDARGRATLAFATFIDQKAKHRRLITALVGTLPRRPCWILPHGAPSGNAYEAVHVSDAGREPFNPASCVQATLAIDRVKPTVGSRLTLFRIFEELRGSTARAAMMRRGSPDQFIVIKAAAIAPAVIHQRRHSNRD